MDPRIEVIDKRLKDVKRIIAVAGGKGGIGKSSVASTLALILSKMGHKVGLFDLDFSGPSSHIILGIKDYEFPKEDKGIVPSEYYGIKFLSIISFSEENPSPLRGIDISNAVIELLAITQWGSLDYLIIDMPPGIGDATLDIIRIIKRAEFIVITTPSKLSIQTVKKSLQLLLELKVPIIGVIENMLDRSVYPNSPFVVLRRTGKSRKFTKSLSIKEQVKAFNIPFLGEIYFDKDFEDSIGNVNKLYNTSFAQSLKRIVLKILQNYPTK
ncbi:MAG: P-loop NTPase [Candidatus Cloacimonadota bacterium]|nr:P-loop NTPase [Candidatus Cloacimonadota bacterium]